MSTQDLKALERVHKLCALPKDEVPFELRRPLERLQIQLENRFSWTSKGAAFESGLAPIYASTPLRAGRSRFNGEHDTSLDVSYDDESTDESVSQDTHGGESADEADDHEDVTEDDGEESDSDDGSLGEDATPAQVRALYRERNRLDQRKSRAKGGQQEQILEDFNKVIHAMVVAYLQAHTAQRDPAQDSVIIALHAKISPELSRTARLLAPHRQSGLGGQRRHTRSLFFRNLPFAWVHTHQSFARRPITNHDLCHRQVRRLYGYLMLAAQYPRCTDDEKRKWCEKQGGQPIWIKRDL